VNGYRQGILVTGRTRMSLDLRGGHVSQGTRGPLCARTERGGAVSDGGYTKIREQHLLVLPDQYILRLDIAMDKLLFMRILQGCCHLLHKGDDLREGYQLPFGIALSQGAIGGIIHHQKGDTLLNIEIEHTHNRGMRKGSNGFGFLLEVLGL